MHTHNETLARYLRQALGDIPPAAIDFITRQVEWVELGAGRTLMTEGDAGDSAFLIVGGRLRAYRRSADNGPPQLLREMARGEVVGEMSLYTGEPRSASVVAVRDSVLARLGREAFHQLLALSPEASIALTRRLVQRLRSLSEGVHVSRPVALALVAVSDGVDVPALARQLAAALAQPRPDGSVRRVALVDAAAVDAALGEPGLAVRDGDGVERRIALWLDQQEAAHDHVLLVADALPNAWTRRCVRRCDERLLVADAAAPPQLHATERAFLTGDGEQAAGAEAAETLLLLHPADTAQPRGTRAWLERRPVRGHVHLRPALPRDIARLARLVSGTAVGLVLAGGGARGFAHLGIWRALEAQGVEFDWVGGTSMGSVMAALVAADQGSARGIDVAQRAFAVNPTGDFNWLPMLSLIKGRRLERVVESALAELCGPDVGAEDLWKNYFCVASNYSRARLEVLQRGPLGRMIRASTAIPGALPPVPVDGDLLCDGGTFANFPVEVMRGMPGVGRVIGVDLGARRPRRVDDPQVPSSWALLIDRLRPRRSRKHRYPSLVSYLMNVTILVSAADQDRARRRTDLHFNPPVGNVGMLEWRKFDSILRQGEAHAAEVLGKLAPEQLAAWRAAAAPR
jgi:NTE family protein